MDFEKNLGLAPKSSGIKFWMVISGFLILVLLVALLFALLIYTKTCNNQECFSSALLNCRRAQWTRSDQGVWNYRIIGSNDKNSCKVDVKLLKINNGSSDAEKLQGEEMSCNVVKNDAQYPEKDLKKCTGQLKEDIQDAIIQRMYNYLLQNVGKIQNNFKSV